MYKLHLILKYLRKRRIAWVSLIAVMLCTMMVLVVISIMGGWLRMFRESFHALGGDVIVSSRALSGFAHYQEMSEQITKLPDVKAAVPMIKTFGLIKINNISPDAVQVVGIPIADVGKVNKFPESLHRQFEVPKDEAKPPPAPSFNLIEGKDYAAIAPRFMKNPTRYPGMILGAGMAGVYKDKDGVVHRPAGLLDAYARLEVMGLTGEEASLQGATPTPNYYWIVDDSHTGVWPVDSKTAYVPFDILQKDLGMAERKITNPDTNETATRPARTTDLHIKLADGVDPRIAKKAITDIVAQFYPFVREEDSPIQVQTWEESNAMFLDAVEHEKGLVTFLFGLISIVAIFLIFCIFYMIVVEKTRDIGIIKSVGATSSGIASIFLGYGLAIGIVGGLLGLLSGFLIVHYINEIHTWLGKTTGLVIWNPEVYAFDIIPNTMNPREVVVIVTVAIVSSVIGALVPAWRAAQMNPVEALRWE